MVCEACSQDVNSGARFCSHCGQPTTAPAWNAGEPRVDAPKLMRSRDRMLGGVCAGIALHYGWDVALVRILAVVVFFCGFGSVGIAYLAAWIIMPSAPMYVAPYVPTSSYPTSPGSAPIS